MACKNVCRLCRSFTPTQSITFSGGQLVLQIAANSYRNCDKVCIVTTQNIPDTATVNAPVVVQIGTGPVLYPLIKKNCRQATAKDIRTRTKYSTCVETTAESGIFRLLGCLCNQTEDNLQSINGDGIPVTTAENAGMEV